MATLAGTPKPPSGHSALATNPDYEITVEAEPKRMRVVFNGETIADSNKTVLLHETRLPDTHYFPRQDVAMDFLNSTDHHTFCPYKGNASYWSIVAGGKPFSRGNLYQFLSNPLYIGKVPHKGETYPGQHKAIIDQATWDTVQRILAGNAVDRSCPTNTRAGFLLTGLVFDETGEPLCQSQADKKGKRYRYYVSKRLMHDAHKSLDGWRLPAGSLEATVVTPIQDLLQDQVRLMDMLHLEHLSPSILKLLKTHSDTMAIKLTEGEPGAQRELLQGVIQRVALSSKSIIITLDQKGLAEILKVSDIVSIHGQDGTATIAVPITLQRRGVGAKLIITGSGKIQHQPDPRLCHLIAQARLWFDQLASGKAASVRVIAQHENIYETEVSRILPLAFLAPKIIEAILDGRQAEELTVKSLKRLGPLPSDWEAQQKLLRISG